MDLTKMKPPKWMLLAGVVVVTAAAIWAVFHTGRSSAPQAATPPDLLTLESFGRALEDPDELRSSYFFSAYLQGLDASNVSDALTVIEQSGRQLTSWELEMLMLAWSRFDPQEAFNRALFDVRQHGRRNVGAAMYAWAVRDPVAAHGALLGLKGDDLEEYLQGKLVAGWVRGGGLDDATAYVSGQESGLVRQFLTRVIAEELGERSAAAVIEWSESIPVDADPEFKKTVFSKSTSTLVRIDPPATAEWLGRHVDEKYAEGCTWLLAWNWLDSDPRATFAWLASLPPGTRRAEAVRKSFAYWIEADPGAAESWLEAAPPSASLDPAVRVVVKRKLADSPTTAIDWAHRIDDKGTRELVLVNIGKRWMREDPAAATRWLESSGLPPNARRAILRSSS